MANSPRYQGFLDPPYIVILTDDSGAALDLTGCVSSSFTLTMLNIGTKQAQQGNGLWTVANQTTSKGQASYQWTTNDMATPGEWLVYTTVKLPAEPSVRPFDPELIEILPGTVGAGAAPPGVLPASTPAATLPFLNIRDFGGIGDGSTDNTTPIFNARAAARALGGGVILYGPGTFLSGNQDISSDVGIYHAGAGVGATVIKLKNGANTDLFSGQTNLINLSAARAAGSDGSLYNFGFGNMTLDGNKSNQTGGPSWLLRFYGYGFMLDTVEITNGYSGGMLIDWNGTGIHNHNGVEARIRNLHCHNASGMGLQMGGPHDSQITNVIVSENGGIGLHLCPNAGGIQIDNFHSWGNSGTGLPGVLIEGGDNQFENAVFESPSDTAQYCLVLAANDNRVNGKCLSSGAFSGIKLGQNSGETPIAGQILQSAGVTLYNPADNCTLDMIFEGCTGTNGALNFDKVHFSKIKAVTIQASGSAYTGFLDPTNQYELLAPNGLTPDGSVGKGGQTRIAADSNNAFTVGGANQYLDYFNVSTHTNPRFEMPNGVYLQFYSDQYSTATSALRVGSGAPSNGTGTNGDYYFRSDTPGTANQRIYVKSAGAWVGIV